MDFLYLIFYGCLRLRFLDVETNCSRFRSPVLLCRGKMNWAHGMAAYVRDGYGAFHQPKFECGCCEMMFYGVCGVRQNLYEYSLYCKPDLDDPIFHCLLASMAAVQAEDVRASFLFVGDLHGHLQDDWCQGRLIFVPFLYASFPSFSCCLDFR